MASYDPLYVQFLHYFNEEQDYYECHEVMEELWLSEGRHRLYQGLLQAAVALYHFTNDNISGAIKLFQGGIEKMELYPDHDLGIRLDKFIAECRDYLNKLNRYDEEPFSFYPLYIEITDPELKRQVDALKENKGK
jgi:predicted metal-dependent hydrolase